MTWLQDQFSLLKEFLHTDFRRILALCALGMAGAIAAGVCVGLLSPETVMQAAELFMEQIEAAGVVDEAGNFSVFALLVNNWQAMLFAAAYGFIPFLFLPVLSLLINGALVGMLGGLYLSVGALPLYLAGTLPHGIFELPAIVLSVACGVCLCRNLCRIITGSPRRAPMVEVLGDLLRVLLLMVMPLTVAAAVLECYVTPLAIGLFA